MHLDRRTPLTAFRGAPLTMSRLTLRLALAATCTLGSAALGSCSRPNPIPSRETIGIVAPASSALYEPSRDLGALFHDVQVGSVFEDSKTFVDAMPMAPPGEILQRYASEKAQP